MSREITPTLHHIIDMIYEASRQPAAWQVSLDHLRNYLNARSAILMYRNHRLSRANFAVFSGITAEQLGSCEQVPWNDETRQREARAAAGELLPVSLASIGSGSAGGCYRQLGVAYVAHGWLFDDADHSAQLEFHRGEGTAPFEPDVLEHVAQLSEHFERALRIYAMARSEQQRQKALSEGLEQFTMGVLLFDEKGEVVYHNKAAGWLLRHYPAVQLHQQRLVIKEPSQAESFRLALTAAIQSGDGDDEVAGMALALGGPAGEGALQGWMMPLRNQWSQHGEGIARAVAALYLSDAQRSLPLRVEPLMVIYGLSKKEAEVAVAIAAGRSVEEIAQLHSRSLNTVRSQLKAVFSKTGTQRQTDLVRLVLDGSHLFIPLGGVIAGESRHG